MKSLVVLVEKMLLDSSIWCRTCTTMDIKTVHRRVEDEGISFLTITLPAFCKDFERSLDIGHIAPGMFLGFARRGHSDHYEDSKGRGVLPRFLGGLLELVFHKYTGVLLEQPDVTAIFFIRQILLSCKKVKLETTELRTNRAYRSFIECENEVRDWSTALHERDIAHFADVSSLLWGRVLCDVDREVHDREHVPKHGKGATAERISGNGKYVWKRWHSRLEEYFPSCEYAIPNPGFYRELDTIDFIEPEAESPSRIISVPKTLKTPRIIAIEPVCMQYAQQSIMEILVKSLERSNYLCDSVGFTDQTRNQRMAREGSLNEANGLATIDLSEASDRVSNLLVKVMLRNFPSLSNAVQACRSTRADVPNHGIVSLAKFASMGSATTFPIEAMVFLTIIMSAYVRSQGLSVASLSPSRLRRILKSVRVYGDDIVVPKDMVLSVIAELELYGLKVNTAKSFWTGKFRESCGKDYYDGSDVSVTYIRHLSPASRRDSAEMISIVSLRNQLYEAGLWETTRYLDEQIERLASFPIVMKTSPILGRYSFLGLPSYTKTCPYLHRPLVKGLVVKAQPRPDLLDGVGALMKFFLKRGQDPFFDKKHLQRYGRPQHVDTKVVWACPY